MTLSKKEIKMASVTLAVRMDNNNDIRTVLKNADAIEKWIMK